MELPSIHLPLTTDVLEKIQKLYSASRGKDNFYHCPWEGTEGCKHKRHGKYSEHKRAVDSHCLPFRCVVSNCERKFGRKGELVKHSRMHQEEKPELRSQASQTDAMPEAQSLLEQSKVNAQNNSETVEHFFASCYDTFNHISAARLAKRIEATIRVGKLANILTKSIAELYSQIPSICQPQQGCFWQDSKNKVLTPNNDVFQDREFFQDKNFIDIFQENEFMDGITKSWLDLSSTTLKALIAGTHPASYFLELARHLIDLRNFHHATAIGDALKNSRFQDSTSPVWTIIDPTNNFAASKNEMVKGPCIPLIFRYVKELQDERREKRTAKLADWKNELWARNVRNNYQLFKEACDQISLIVRDTYQFSDNDYALVESLGILGTLNPTQIILLACVRTEETMEIGIKFTKFVHGGLTHSQIVDRRNDIVKFIQETDLKGRKRRLAPASLERGIQRME